jgi:hypothetical protein
MSLTRLPLVIRTPTFSKGSVLPKVSGIEKAPAPRRCGGGVTDGGGERPGAELVAVFRLRLEFAWELEREGSDEMPPARREGDGFDRAAA